MMTSNLFLPFFPPVYVRHTSRNIQQELGNDASSHELMTILLTVYVCVFMLVLVPLIYFLARIMCYYFENCK